MESAPMTNKKTIQVKIIVDILLTKTVCIDIFTYNDLNKQKTCFVLKQSIVIKRKDYETIHKSNESPF